jgi:predicted GNAT family N-acyltransferase
LSADSRLTVTVRRALDEAEIAVAQELRMRVFCDEQGVSRELELDGLDAEATHIVALDESGVIATCRLRFAEPAGEAPGSRECKLERMAVEARLRDAGVGLRLLQGAEEEARRAGATAMVLNGQLTARSFYERGGYAATSEEIVEDAGIDHVRMRKELR